jgi:glycine hydroxymethyltransferase
MNTALDEYLKITPPEKINSAMCAYVANLSQTAQVAPQVASAIVGELADQRSNMKMIASENFCSLSTQLSMGNLLTDKYAEGYPMHRFYAGCKNVDDIEAFACEKACALFGAEHAYVQPHSGADANMIAYWAILHAKVQEPLLAHKDVKNPSTLSHSDWEEIRAANGSQKLLGMDYYSGGHLTHGYRHNVSAQMFDAYLYGVDRQSGLLDYDALAQQAREIKPLILLAGYSAYPRRINFAKMREIADEVGAVFMVDMAHFAGLVAGKVFDGDYDPVAHAHVVTSTTHKTLRGPRGGIVLCKKEFADYVDKGCPMVIGGPLPHVMGAKAITFAEADTPAFREYAQNVVDNAQALAASLMEKGGTIATRGTDNHLMLLDVRGFGITGRQAESALRECGITMNRNSLPEDPNGAWYTSGLRIGTPGVTSLGMGTAEMEEIGDIISTVLAGVHPTTVESGPNKGKTSKAKYTIDDGIMDQAKARVQKLLDAHVLYPELDLAFLQTHFRG